MNREFIDMIPKKMSNETKFGKLDIKISFYFNRHCDKKYFKTGLCWWLIQLNNILKLFKYILIVGEYMIHKLYINATDNKQPQSDVCVCSESLSHVQLLFGHGLYLTRFPLSMGFCGQESTRMGHHFLLHMTFLTQRLNPYSCIGRKIFYHSTAWDALIRSVVAQKNKVKDLSETNS